MADELKHSEILQAFDSSFKRDAWQNTITGVGQLGRDKRLAACAAPIIFALADLTDAYRADDMIQKIVDLPAIDMTRAWLDIRVPDDDGEIGELLGKDMERLQAREHFKDGLRWENLYGGSVMFVGANDGQSDPRKELKEDKIKSIDFLTVFAPDEVRVLDWQNNPFEEGYALPKTYQITPRIVGLDGKGMLLNEVHASRVIHFPGKLANRWQTQLSASAYGFGDSKLVSAFSVVRDFAAAFDGSSTLLADFSQAVIKINGLARAVAGDRGDLVKARLALIDYSRSTMRMIAIDAENEEFKREPTPMTGLPDLLQMFMLRLSAAADMPVSKLMGQAPTGLNATGEGDAQNYFDNIAGKQITHLDPRVRRLVKLLMLAKEGPCKGTEPENWSTDYRPLFSPPESEQAETRLKMAQADKAYFEIGALGFDEIRNSRWRGDRYSVNTQVEDTVIAEETDSDLLEQTNNEDPSAPPVEGTPSEEVAPKEGEENASKVDPKDPKASLKPKPGAKPIILPPGKGPDGKPLPQLPGQAPNVVQPGNAGGEGAKAQDKSLNGAQISSMLEIIKAGVSGEISRESMIQALMTGLLITEQEALALAGPEDFEPVQPEPTASELMGNEVAQGGLKLKEKEIGLKAKAFGAKAKAKPGAPKKDAKPKRKVTKG